MEVNFWSREVLLIVNIFFSSSSTDTDGSYSEDGEEMLRPPAKQSRSNSMFAYRNKQPQSVHSFVMFQ